MKRVCMEKLMRTLSKKVLQPFFMAGIVCMPGVVFACSCVPQSVEEYYRQADIVFVGKVLDIPRTNDAQFELRVKMQILTTFKGTATEDVISVKTASADGLCGYSFVKDEEVLVYGIGSRGEYSTGICRGTKSLVDASADISQLSKGVGQDDFVPTQAMMDSPVQSNLDTDKSAGLPAAEKP